MAYVRHMRNNNNEPIKEVVVSTPPNQSTVEQLLALQQALSQLESLIQAGNIFLLRTRALILSALPEVSYWTSSSLIILEQKRWIGLEYQLVVGVFNSWACGLHGHIGFLIYQGSGPHLAVLVCIHEHLPSYLWLLILMKVVGITCRLRIRWWCCCLDWLQLCLFFQLAGWCWLPSWMFLQAKCQQGQKALAASHEGSANGGMAYQLSRSAFWNLKRERTLPNRHCFAFRSLSRLCIYSCMWQVKRYMKSLSLWIADEFYCTIGASQTDWQEA